MAARDDIGAGPWPLRAAIVLPLRGPAGLQLALDVLTHLDALTLANNPNIPPLYASGVRYARESRLIGEGREVPALDPVSGTVEERFNHLSRVLEIGAGDCDDLACWRAAELQVRAGIPARAVPVRSDTGWHVVVRLPDGSIDDPSARLGMYSIDGQRR